MSQGGEKLAYNSTQIGTQRLVGSEAQSSASGAYREYKYPRDRLQQNKTSRRIKEDEGNRRVCKEQAKPVDMLKYREVYTWSLHMLNDVN